ncbi:MAG: hypothetical protein RI908_1506, partial [Actinomycetota bacterium]
MSVTFKDKMASSGTDNVTTVGISVPLAIPLPPPIPSDGRRVRSIWWALPMLTVAWLMIVLVFAASLTRVRLWELAPGSAQSVAPRMTFGDDARQFATVFKSNGEVMFVTALGSQLTLLDVVAAWIDDDVDILTFEERFGTQTPSQLRESNSRAMV